MKREVHNFSRKVAIQIACICFQQLTSVFSLSLIAQVFRFSKKLEFCCNMQYTDFCLLASAIKVSMIGR